MTYLKGDFVTVSLPEGNEYSNVYEVRGVLQEENTVILSHPLYPSALIEKPISEVDKAAPSIKQPLESCLEFCKKYKNMLSYDAASDLDSICAYFVINKRLAGVHKKNIAVHCGSIAVIQLDNNFSLACRKVLDNEGVLDDYNLTWYYRFKSIIEGNKVASPKQRQSIFNLAGFVLSQLEQNKTEIRDDQV